MTDRPSDPLPVTVAECSTLVEILRWRARHQRGRLACTALREGEEHEESWTFAELDRRARTVAAGLLGEGACGERVILLFPSGLEFAAAFMGCLYAGAVAVPALPPRPGRSLAKLQKIVESATPRILLSTPRLLGKLEMQLGEKGLGHLRCFVNDESNDGAHDSWIEPMPAPTDLAFLQYTSGSTAEPKGVMVSHGNLMANHRMLQAAFEQTQDSTIVTWLPLFHDMGLIGNLLQGVFLGARTVLMSPESFLVKPVRWLQAISRYGAHTSGGPNFAFEHCARRITPEQKAGLDLSGWEVAFNGAEPVRHATLELFAEAFAGCGFRWESFYPCYGLAEATLFVSGGAKSDPPRPLTPRSPERDSTTGSGATRFLVGCGHAWEGGEVIVADPVTLEPCVAGETGEILIAGSHVTLGYWNAPAATHETFGIRLPGRGERRYLRTGDLGFMAGDELCLTGRRKDLIIIAGRNHYPGDLEQTVEASHPSLRRANSAAFSVEEDGVERLVIMAEVERHSGAAAPEIQSAIRRALAEEHGLAVHCVVLLSPATLLKTSSGKIQRHACRAAFLADGAGPPGTSAG